MANCRKYWIRKSWNNMSDPILRRSPPNQPYFPMCWIPICGSSLHFLECPLASHTPYARSNLLIGSVAYLSRPMSVCRFIGWLMGQCRSVCQKTRDVTLPCSYRCTLSVFFICALLSNVQFSSEKYVISLLVPFPSYHNAFHDWLKQFFFRNGPPRTWF